MIRRNIITALSIIAVGHALAGTPRERMLIDDDWKFTKGDPTNVNSQSLLYDVRPAGKGEDQKERLAEATEDAVKLGADTNAVLKPWILPTGNRFIKDPARRYVRPAGNPGGDVAYVRSDFDDSVWSRVTLPHDWAIGGPFNSGGVGGGMGRLPSPGIGWYRKRLYIPAGDAGKEIFLEVNGAMSYAAVWVNGTLVGGWPYGYASWQLDLTPYLIPGGDNELAIRLDNPPDFSRWYPGAGLYRDIWLIKTQPVHVGQWGTSLTTPQVTAEATTVYLDVTVDNDAKADAAVTMATEIFALDAKGRKTGSAVARIAAKDLQIAAGQSAVASGQAIVLKPKLWGPPPTQQPNRYVAVTTISRGSEVMDEYETSFGIRAVEFKPDGLYVNGERIAIKGVNLHHDLGALGAAFNISAAERRLNILRDMGCNAIRMSHNPPDPKLLELTDRMGFLVMDEIFDSWVRQKTPFDFHLIFPDWHEQDVRAFIARDRNHPSVFLWSMGNEVGEQYTGEDGAMVAREMVALAHDADPTRPATASMNFAKPDSAFAAAMDVISLNYQGEGIRDTPEFDNFKGNRTPPQYPGFQQKFPDKMIFSSESAAVFSSRGVYLFPVAQGASNAGRDGAGEDSHTQQVSGYELYAAGFGSSPDKVFGSLDRHPYVAGEFVWAGWDYLGEPTPYYSARSSYYGILDLAGFKKDRFYLYQAHWRPDLPMAHILPHWTWPERVGQITPVHVFTSGDEAELFLNGKSLGRKKKGAFEYRLRWDDVVYEPGTLKVVAYKDGKRWATDEVRTAGTAAKLKVEAEQTKIRADGKSLAFVNVTVVDNHGVTVPQANDLIHFAIEGPGEIVATDNGDPTNLVSFPSHDRQAFNGLCQVIVRGMAGKAGKIKVMATAEGLKAGSETIQMANP